MAVCVCVCVCIIICVCDLTWKKPLTTIKDCIRTVYTYPTTQTLVYTIHHIHTLVTPPAQIAITLNSQLNLNKS